MAQEWWSKDQTVEPAQSVRQGVVIPKAGPTPIELQAAQIAKESAARAEVSSIISQAAEKRAVSEDERKRIKELRDAYRGEDAVRDYEKAFPNYVAALKTNPNEDLTLLYLYAKTIDPQSTVGASDMENINASDARLPAAVQGALRELRASDGKFTDAARTSIRSGLHKVITEKNQAYKFTRDRFMTDAKSDVYNVDPMLVVGQPFGTQQQVDDVKSYWRKEYERNPESIPQAYRREEVAIPALKVAEAGGPRAADRDIAVARALQAAWQAGDSIERLNEITQSMGTDPLPPETIKALQEDTDRQIKFTPFMAPTKDVTEDMGLISGAIEAVTGEERSTAETQSLPDWTTMPELNQLSTSSAAASLGTMFTSPEESVKIIQSNYPGVQVRQDEKGNFILRSENGQEYAIKPGFRWSDVPRVAGGILAFLPSAGARTVAGAAGGAGLTQGIIEATQAATGGTYNPEEVAMAAGFGAGGKYLEQIVPPAIAAVRGMRRGPEVPLGATPEVPAGMGGTVPEMSPMSPAQAAPLTPAETVVDGAVPRIFEAGETVTSRAGGAMGTSPEQIRLMQAEGLPVPVQLTRGAAARDPEQLAFEKEQIFSELGGPLRRRAEENNLQALQNFDRFIDMTGAEAPDIASTGNAVIKALSQGYQASKNRVRTAYTEADKAGETAELVSYNGLVDFINQQTPTTRTSLAPILQSTLEKLRMEDPSGSGLISIRALEDVRKAVNKAVQPGTPNATYGTAIKDLIDTATEGVGGDLYKKARQLRIDQADKFEKRAIVARLVSNIKNMDDRRVPADRVFKTAILNESPENIQFLRRTLRDLGDDGKQAWSELQGATLRHIQERATANVNKTAENLDVISAAQLNKAVDELDKNGRLDLIFNPKMAQQVRDLRDVVQYVNTVPPGTSINTSGTARTLAAALGEMVVTGTTTSIPLPILTGIKVIRDQIRDAKIKKQINRSLLPRGEQD